MRLVVGLLLVTALLSNEFVVAGDVGLEAQWLWSSRFPRANETIRLRREFTVSGSVRRAELRGLADDHAKVFLDRRLVIEVNSARRFTTSEVLSLTDGKHLLEIEATNRGGAAGVWLQLDWKCAEGPAQRLVTDGDWEVRDSRGEWLRATSLGLLGIPPWWRPAGEIDDYDQWKRAIGTGQADEAARVRVVPGFEVELVRSSQKGEGSWVSLTFDAKGRLIVGREGAGILRMTNVAHVSNVPSQPPAEIKVELINDQLQECRGLLWAFDSLYANANNSKGLYRLRDTDGDDQFDDVKLLKATGGGVGHGRNALALGPDNLIYVIHGNNVLVSETDRTIADDSPLRHIAEDRLRPAYWDRFMFDSDAKVPAGYVARTDADGSFWQVVAGGFRNPYGIDFNADGEMFTWDADNEGDQGTPWYRPTRINHIVSGGDYGFRQGSANRPGHYAEHLPSILNMGLSSPTGVRSGHRGKFPSPYDKALFVCDWSYGRIHAIHLDPAGASYRCRAELFLEGQPLNVTDLTFGPDGAIYFTTGGRGTQSGLYRVRSVEKVAGSPGISGKANRFFDQRRQIERWHSVAEPSVIEWLLSLQDGNDVWIRHAARVALERLPIGLWQDRILERQGHYSVATRIMAMLALMRVAGVSGQKAELQRRVCDRTSTLPWRELSVEERMDAWRVYSVAFARLGRPSEDVAKAVTDVLASQYPQELEEPNQRLCELLAYLEWPPLVEKTIPRLEQAVEQEDKLAYLNILRNVPVGWTLDLRRRYFAELRKADLFDGGNLLPIAINGIREEALAMLTDDERRALGALLEPAAEAGGDLATVTGAKPVVREWRLEELEAAVKNTTAPRDVARGEKLFRETLCLRCHRFGTEGRTLGPDLTFVANRFGPRDLLEHILVPSKAIDGKYRQTIVETKSGQVLTGRVVGGDVENLLLAPDPLRPTKVTKVALNDIEARKSSPVSPMPIGLLNSLTEPEILDLLEYLRVGRR